MMKNVLLMWITLTAFNTNAGRITMSNPEQTTMASGRTLCVLQ